jgi:hypothetical protein
MLSILSNDQIEFSLTNYYHMILPESAIVFIHAVSAAKLNGTAIAAWVDRGEEPVDWKLSFLSKA